MPNGPAGGAGGPYALLPFKEISALLFFSSLFGRKIGVNRNAVKSLVYAHALRSVVRARLSERDPSSLLPPAAPSCARRDAGWSGILTAALVLCAAVLWLYNRAFTAEKPVVRASRFTSGNTVFPVQVAVFADRVSSHNPRFLGHTENSITLRQIASVKVKSGPVFADARHRHGGRFSAGRDPRALEEGRRGAQRRHRRGAVHVAVSGEARRARRRAAPAPATR